VAVKFEPNCAKCRGQYGDLELPLEVPGVEVNGSCPLGCSGRWLPF